MFGKDIDPISGIHFFVISVQQQTQHVFMLLFALLPTALSAGSNGEFIFVLPPELKLDALHNKL